MTTRIVGYCASCRHFRFHREERAIFGTARFGRCLLAVKTEFAACPLYVPKPELERSQRDGAAD